MVSPHGSSPEILSTSDFNNRPPSLLPHHHIQQHGESNFSSHASPSPALQQQKFHTTPQYPLNDRSELNLPSIETSTTSTTIGASPYSNHLCDVTSDSRSPISIDHVHESGLVDVTNHRYTRKRTFSNSTSIPNGRKSGYDTNTKTGIWQQQQQHGYNRWTTPSNSNSNHIGGSNSIGSTNIQHPCPSGNNPVTNTDCNNATFNNNNQFYYQKFSRSNGGARQQPTSGLGCHWTNYNRVNTNFPNGQRSNTMIDELILCGTQPFNTNRILNDQQSQQQQNFLPHNFWGNGSMAVGFNNHSEQQIGKVFPVLIAPTIQQQGNGQSSSLQPGIMSPTGTQTWQQQLQKEKHQSKQFHQLLDSNNILAASTVGFLDQDSINQFPVALKSDPSENLQGNRGHLTNRTTNIQHQQQSDVNHQPYDFSHQHPASMASGIAVTQMRRLAPNLKPQATPLVSASVVGCPILPVGSPSFLNPSTTTAADISAPGSSLFYQSPSNGLQKSIGQQKFNFSKHQNSNNHLINDEHQQQGLINNKNHNRSLIGSVASDQAQQRNKVHNDGYSKNDTVSALLSLSCKSSDQQSAAATIISPDSSSPVHQKLENNQSILSNMTIERQKETPATILEGGESKRLREEEKEKGEVRSDNKLDAPSVISDHNHVGTSKNFPVRLTRPEWYFQSGRISRRKHRLRRRVTSWSPTAYRREKRLLLEEAVSALAVSQYRQQGNSMPSTAALKKAMVHLPPGSSRAAAAWLLSRCGGADRLSSLKQSPSMNRSNVPGLGSSPTNSCNACTINGSLDSTVNLDVDQPHNQESSAQSCSNESCNGQVKSSSFTANFPSVKISDFSRNLPDPNEFLETPNEATGTISSEQGGVQSISDTLCSTPSTSSLVINSSTSSTSIPLMVSLTPLQSFTPPQQQWHQQQQANFLVPFQWNQGQSQPQQRLPLVPSALLNQQQSDRESISNQSTFNTAPLHQQSPSTNSNLFMVSTPQHFIQHQQTLMIRESLQRQQQQQMVPQLTLVNDSDKKPIQCFVSPQQRDATPTSMPSVLQQQSYPPGTNAAQLISMMMRNSVPSNTQWSFIPISATTINVNSTVKDGNNVGSILNSSVGCSDSLAEYDEHSSNIMPISNIDGNSSLQIPSTASSESRTQQEEYRSRRVVNVGLKTAGTTEQRRQSISVVPSRTLTDATSQYQLSDQQANCYSSLGGSITALGQSPGTTELSSNNSKTTVHSSIDDLVVRQQQMHQNSADWATMKVGQQHHQTSEQLQNFSFSSPSRYLEDLYHQHQQQQQITNKYPNSSFNYQSIYLQQNISTNQQHGLQQFSDTGTMNHNSSYNSMDLSFRSTTNGLASQQAQKPLTSIQQWNRHRRASEDPYRRVSTASTHSHQRPLQRCESNNYQRLGSSDSIDFNNSNLLKSNNSNNGATPYKNGAHDATTTTQKQQPPPVVSASIKSGNLKRPLRSIPSPQPYFHFWFPSTTNLETNHLNGISESISLSIKHFVLSVDQEIASRNGPLKLRIVNSIRSEVLRFLRKSPTIAKFLPSTQSPNSRRLNNRRHDGVDVIPYGSYCSNLFLPWSDIDLAITGLHLPQQNHHSFHYTKPDIPRVVMISGTPHSITPGTRAAGYSPEITSSNFGSTVASSNNGSMNTTIPTASSTLDPRHEILQELQDFFDGNTMTDLQSSRGKQRNDSNNGLKCRHDLLQQFYNPQFKPSRHTPLLTIYFNLSSDRSISATSHLDISILSNTHTGIEAIRLLKFYSAFFPTMRPLVLVLKQAMCRRHINIPYEGGLPSYALCLMVIAFLTSPSLYNYRMHDAGFQLLNFLAFYGDIPVPSDGYIQLSQSIPSPKSLDPTSHSNDSSITDETVKVKSFNYYNVAITVMIPEQFVQSQTFRHCLRLLGGPQNDGEIGNICSKGKDKSETSSINQQSQQFNKTEKHEQQSSIAASMLKATKKDIWPSVQDTNSHSPRSQESSSSSNCSETQLQNKSVLKALQLTIENTDTSIKTSIKEKQPKAKLSYAAVARPGKLLVREGNIGTSRGNTLKEEKTKIISSLSSAPVKLNVWTTSPSASLREAVKQGGDKKWASLSEITSCRVEKELCLPAFKNSSDNTNTHTNNIESCCCSTSRSQQNDSTSTSSIISDGHFQRRRCLNRSSSARPVSKNQPTSPPCFKALDFPQLADDYHSSSATTVQPINLNCSTGEEGIGSSGAHYSFDLNMTPMTPISLDIKGNDIILEEVKNENFKKGKISDRESLVQVNLYDQKNTKGNKPSRFNSINHLNTNEEDLSLSCESTAQTPFFESASIGEGSELQQYCESSIETTALVEKCNPPTSPVDVILPSSAASSQSSVLFAVRDSSKAMQHQTTDDLNNQCISKDLINEEDHQKDEINRLQSPHPSSAISPFECHDIVPPFDNGLKDSTEIGTAIRHSSNTLSSEPFSSEMFELIPSAFKVDSFIMGHRLEIRDPIDPTNNVGRPAFNATGIKTSFAHAYRDLLRIPLCPTCSTESNTGILEQHIENRGGHWHIALGFNTHDETKSSSSNSTSVIEIPSVDSKTSKFQLQIESWSYAAQNKNSNQTVTPLSSTYPTNYSHLQNASSFQTNEGSLGCIACCGALRCIV